jgi:multiple RNA-binding domain-containing protein 1
VDVPTHTVLPQIHPSRMALRDDMPKATEEKKSEPSQAEATPSNVHPSRLERMASATVMTPPTTPKSSETLNADSKPLSDSVKEDEANSEEEEEPTKTDEEKQKKTDHEEEVLPPVELIGDTGRLFVRNLTYTVDKEELESLFTPFGPVSEIHIPIFRDTKLQKGFAFVEFLMPENAVQAYSVLDGSIFQGRILEILPGKEKLQKADEEDDDQNGRGGKSFKSKKEKDQKTTAGNDFNWNSLFMNVSGFLGLLLKINFKQTTKILILR